MGSEMCIRDSPGGSVWRAQPLDRFGESRGRAEQCGYVAEQNPGLWMIRDRADVIFEIHGVVMSDCGSTKVARASSESSSPFG